MVLVDTSVWIRFLAGREPYARALDRLLSTDEVLAHDLVEGELLIGASAGPARLLADYALTGRATMVPHSEVVEFSRRRGLQGRRIGWIDTHLLASALVERCRLWTADARLGAVAEELVVAYTPSL